jgi:hypothetical protein
MCWVAGKYAQTIYRIFSHIPVVCSLFKYLPRDLQRMSFLICMFTLSLKRYSEVVSCALLTRSLIFISSCFCFKWNLIWSRIVGCCQLQCLVFRTRFQSYRNKLGRYRGALSSVILTWVDCAMYLLVDVICISGTQTLIHKEVVGVESKGFWRWCITHRITGFVDCVPRSEF